MRARERPPRPPRPGARGRAPASPSRTTAATAPRRGAPAAARHPAAPRSPRCRTLAAAVSASHSGRSQPRPWRRRFLRPRSTRRRPPRRSSPASSPAVAEGSRRDGGRPPRAADEPPPPVLDERRSGGHALQWPAPRELKCRKERAGRRRSAPSEAARASLGAQAAPCWRHGRSVGCEQRWSSAVEVPERSTFAARFSAAARGGRPAARARHPSAEVRARTRPALPRRSARELDAGGGGRDEVEDA